MGMLAQSSSNRTRLLARQSAETISGRPLLALEDRPAEQLKASAGYWDSEVENFRTVGL